MFGRRVFRFFSSIKLELGSYKKIIPIKPSFDNQLFVDKNTLVSYYKEEEKEQKTNIKKLKKFK